MYLNNNLPSLDLHGENRDTARILVNEFIEDNYKLGKQEVIIIHGNGEGILKKEVQKVLKSNKKVSKFKIDNFNAGCTIAVIDKNNEKCYNTRNMRGGY